MANPLLVQTLITCLGMYDWSLAIKLHLHMLVSGRRGGRGSAPPRPWQEAKALREQVLIYVHDMQPVDADGARGLCWWSAFAGL